MFQHYACGFLFSEDRTRVVLIRKHRPPWQAGKLNGVGGKLERDEIAPQAMRREFREEAGVDIDSWQHILTLSGKDWAGHFFRAFGDIDAARSLTDEKLEIHRIHELPRDTIPNLRWMIPLMLDDEPAGGVYEL